MRHLNDASKHEAVSRPVQLNSTQLDGFLTGRRDVLSVMRLLQWWYAMNWQQQQRSIAYLISHRRRTCSLRFPVCSIYGIDACRSDCLSSGPLASRAYACTCGKTTP